MSVSRTYIGEPGRHYPELAVTPKPGDTVKFAKASQVPGDGRWQELGAKKTRKPRGATRQGPVTLPQTPPQPDPDATAPASTEE